MYPLLRRSSLESSKTINHADCLSCAAGSWILQSNKSRPVSRPVRADFPARTSLGFRTECNITHRLLRCAATPPGTQGLLRGARSNSYLTRAGLLRGVRINSSLHGRVATRSASQPPPRGGVLHGVTVGLLRGDTATVSKCPVLPRITTRSSRVHGGNAVGRGTELA